MPKGRPKKEVTYRKTLGVNVSQDEFMALSLVSKSLGYKSISGFLRSAISKGILLSCRNEEHTYTKNEDKIHWNYLVQHWSLTSHFSENSELTNFVSDSKTK